LQDFKCEAEKLQNFELPKAQERDTIKEKYVKELIHEG
jgi:hypothetical protein